MPLAQSENIQINQYLHGDSIIEVKEEIVMKNGNEVSTIKRNAVPTCNRVESIDSCLGKSQITNNNNANTFLHTNYQKEFHSNTIPHHTSELAIKEVMNGDQNSEDSKKALHFYLGLWEADQCERRQQNRRRKALQRAQETAERRQRRREKDRFAKAALRAAETMEKRVKRREKDRIAKALSRMRETEEQRKIRLEKNRIAMATLRAAQSDEEKFIRRERDRINKAKTRAVETEEQKRIRREKNRIAMAIKRANMGNQERNYKKRVNCVTKTALKICL